MITIKNRFSSLPFTLCLLTFSILHFPFSIAEVRYVSKTGTSTPPYTTWETAADSIQKCINISSFGDTIYVANGVYEERIDMIPGLSLIGAGMDSCIIDTREFNPNYTVRVTDSCYFAGFHIITYNITAGIGLVIYDANVENIFAIVEKNKITNAKDGIRITSSSLGLDNNIKLINMNIIISVENGIYCAQTIPTIKENIISPIGYGLGSGINSAPTYLNNIVTIENATNTSKGFGSGFDYVSILKNNLFISLDNSGWSGVSSYTDSLSNNIVYGQWDYGIFTAGSIFKNNHIEKTSVGMRDDSEGGQVSIFQHNNLWQNQNNYQNYSADTTNIYFNPMFVNEDSLDFHLQRYSPLIDAGDPIILDKDSTRSDIGLYGGPFSEVYKYQDLAPRPPVNLTGSYDSLNIKIKWNRNTEADFSYYKLFRDTTTDFIADSTTLVISLTDTFYQHIIPGGINKYYYKLTSVDSQGNESEVSEELAVIITSVSTDNPTVISDYRLYQNFPNPFNPTTRIGYKLKERGYVKLYVYDIKGELVSVLVNQNQEAGYYEVEFDTQVLSSEYGAVRQLASGIYIYQIMVRNENDIPVFTDIKKMLMIK